MLYTPEALKLPLDAEDAAALRAWSGPLPLPSVKVIDGRVVGALVAINEGPLASEIARLRRLRSLEVRCNALHGGASSIPDLSPLTELVKLDLAGNPIRVLPVGLGLMRGLEELHAWDCKLTGLPPELFTLTELRKLLLARNELTELPAAIGGLRKLEKLDLADCFISEVPESIGELRELKWLVLRGSFLTVPESLGQLTKLEHLDLSGRFTALPRSFPLHALKRLELHAPLTHVPEGFSKLPLERLVIHSEVLQTLPDVPTLKKLVVPEASARRLVGSMGKLAQEELAVQVEAERMLREAWEDR